VGDLEQRRRATAPGERPAPAATLSVDPAAVAGGPEPVPFASDFGATPRSVEWAREYVYGCISTLVAIGGLTFEQRPDDVSAGWVIIVGAIAIALAHAVSRLVVDWSKQDERHVFDHRVVVGRLRETWPIVSAAIPATAVIALSQTRIYSTHNSLWVAAGVAVAALAVVGVVTAREPHHSIRRRVLYVVSLVTVGLFIVALEVVAHTI